MQTYNNEPADQFLAPKTHYANNKLLVIAAAVLATVCVLAVASFLVLKTISTDSLPGESLYTYKTSLVEEITAYTQFTSDAKVEYDIQRLEMRLSELGTLVNDTSSSSPETLGAFATLIAKHVSEAHTTLQKAGTRSAEEKIDAYAKLATLTRAIEIAVTDMDEFSSITNQLSEIESMTDDNLTSAIGAFVETGDPLALGSYISTQITFVGEQTAALAPGSTAQSQTIRRVSEAQEAIAANDMSAALASILKARQAIEIDSYLWDGERAPQDGSLPEPGPMPEGS
jgi:hypothetical protein